MDSLFENSHVYVSLHRAEGFGLPLLEARAMGLATIATAYSGNLDFMSSSDSVLVPFNLITMEDDGGVYGRATWADPNVAEQHPACDASMKARNSWLNWQMQGGKLASRNGS